MSSKIHSIKLIPVAPTREMFLNPWTLSTTNFQNNDHLIQTMREVTADGTNLSINALAPLANNILVPDARSMRQAGIVGGYSEKRFSIEIIVETVDSQMMSSYETITGYTSHYGFMDAAGKHLIDDDMLIVINGVCNLTRENWGGHDTWKVSDITQILSPVAGSNTSVDINPEFGTPGFESVLDNQMVSCRPTDSLAVMASNNMSGKGNFTTVNSFMLSTGNKRSTRANNMAASYLSNTATAYRNQMLDDTQDDSALLSAAASPLVNDPAMTSMGFLRELRKCTQYGHERSIHWKELRNIDPSLAVNDSRIMVVPGTEQFFANADAILSGSEYWDAAYNETMIAKQMAWSVPAFMSQRNIGHIDIEAHNATIGRQVVVDVHTVSSTHAEIDHRSHLERLKQAYAVAVFNQIAGSLPDRTVYVRINCGLIGVANIVVEIDGKGKHPYNAPIFNDAAWSPQLAGSYSQLEGLAQDLGQLCAAATNSALSSHADFAQLMSHHDNIGTQGHSTAVASQHLAQQPLASTLPPLTTSFGNGGFDTDFKF